jgi:periplasmic copper chaperone A
MKTIKVVSAASVAALALTLALAGSAVAHVTVEPTEGPSDGFATLTFSIPHGCEESPSTRLRVQIPRSVPQVTPGVHPSWDLSVRRGPKDRTELHGETITRGISEVIWTATEPLPPPYLEQFVMSVKLPAGEGETLHFPAIQECEQGQTRWIQIPGPGETEEDLDEPAPAVTLVAAEGGHGGSGGGDEDAPEAEQASAEAEEDDDDDDGNGLAIAALIVGGLGLVAGTGSLIRSRR